MGSNSLNDSIAGHYLPLLASPIKYGESGVLFWFPGSGMTTIAKDVFGNKTVLQAYLGGLTSRLTIIQYWGHLADKKTVAGLLALSDYQNYSQLKDYCLQQLAKGKEVVFVLGRLEDFSFKNTLEVLRLFVKLNDINRRRIHVIFNTTDKPGFEEMLLKNPQLIAIANKMEIVPILNGSLLDKYITTKAKEYEYPLTTAELENIKNTYGGILQLTKEYIRSKGSIHTLELKLRVILQNLHTSYKEVIMDKAKVGKIASNSKLADLKKFGILELNLFQTHRNILTSNPEKLLPNILTDSEIVLWKYISSKPGQSISKDKVIEILRPKNSEDISLWAVDQAMSRFRKKLARAGMDPSQLKTLKGKGYIWQK